MVYRIWLEPGVARLSRQGIDVLSASQPNLLFDGGSAGAAKFIRGSISGVRSDAGTSFSTVMFGKTYSVKPFVMVLLGGSAGWREGAGVFAAIKGFGDSTLPMTDFWYVNGMWTRLEVDVQTDRVNFAIVAFGTSTFAYTIDYQILDYRIGF